MAMYQVREVTEEELNMTKSMLKVLLAGSALMLAGSGKTIAYGVFCLFVFSMGLGLPYILAALFFTRIKGLFLWLKKHGRYIKIASGAVLVVFGLLLAFDAFGYWASFFD